MVCDIKAKELSRRNFNGLNPCCSGRWSATLSHRLLNLFYRVVLILVVVEDGLRPAYFSIKVSLDDVLILVVVEDGLRPPKTHQMCSGPFVLILVVVEDGLRRLDGNRVVVDEPVCLNPCCSGRWSATINYWSG